MTRRRPRRDRVCRILLHTQPLVLLRRITAHSIYLEYMGRLDSCVAFYKLYVNVSAD